LIKKRNMFGQVLLFVSTLGLYGVYWVYTSFSEMNDYLQLEENPALLTLMAFIPFLNYLALYKYAEAVETLSEGSVNKMFMFTVLVVFSPAAWFITQMELNKRATA
jgi:hypothetical protein